MKQSLESFTEGQVAEAIANVRGESEIHLEQLSGQLELAKRQLDDTNQLLEMASQNNADLRAAMQSQQLNYQNQLEQIKINWQAETSNLKQSISALKEHLELFEQKHKEEIALKDQELLEERQSKSEKVVENCSIGCQIELGHELDEKMAELEKEKALLAAQLADLYDETKRVQKNMQEMHAAEMDRANILHLQKLHEIKYVTTI